MKSKMKFVFAGIFFLSYIGFTSFISSSVTSKSPKAENKQVAVKQSNIAVNSLKKTK